MNAIEKIRELYRSYEISKKITLTYALCFIALLLIINVAMWSGTSYALYHPAERTIQVSMENVQKLLEELEENVSASDPNSIREPLISGVVLRVVDSNGEVFIDTDTRYPSLELFEKNIISNPSIFADKDMEVAKIGNALVYRAQMDYVHDDEHVKLYFFRTITSMTNVFDRLTNFMLIIDVLGILFAVGVGNLASKKVLKPIETMTELARGIAFGKMDGRIPVTPANDELTELAKTLNEMLDRLQGGISKQQKFVSDASHELRTPATVIAGYIDLLEKYGAADKSLLTESVDAIRSEAQNMTSLLENLLFLARADQHRQKLHMERFELSEIVGDVMNKMKTVVKTHEVSLLKNDSAKIFGDKTTIRQVLRIFLDNAVKYTPSGGKISVSSVNDDKSKKIHLSISDSGIGIAPENRLKIFDRFFRVDSETLVEEVNGTGLGLSIAKWIADKHGITIEVDGELGKGTTFTLNIPTVNA